MIDKLYILRRKPGGIGGAEKVAARFTETFGKHFPVQRISAGDTIENQKRIGGLKGPPWLRSLRYVRMVDNLKLKQPGNLVFSMELGPECDIYRAGDGVHRQQLRLRYGNSPLWMVNPWHWLAPKMEYKGMKSARVIVANSHMVKRDIATAYPDLESKTTVIHNGFNPEVYYPRREELTSLRARLEMPADAFVMLFSGSGFERKGLKEAIFILEEFLKQEPGKKANTHLYVAGTGRKEPYLPLIKDKGLVGNIHFLGPINNIADYYRAADAMVLPTLYDPFSNSTLESLACGCPVVTTNRNGASEIVQNGKTGYILGNDEPYKDRLAAAAFLHNFNIHREKVAESVAARTLDHELADFLKLFEHVAPTRPIKGDPKTE